MSKELLKRFKDAKSHKSIWDNTYQEGADYTVPERSDFTTTKKPKGQRNPGNRIIYDSGPVTAMSKFVSNIQSSMTPVGKKWGSLVARGEFSDDIDFNEALQAIREKAFLHIHRGGFDTAIAESYEDLALGTGCLLIQPSGKGGIHFSSVPLSDLYLEKGPRGSVGNIYREYKIPFENIEKTWKDADVSSQLEAKYRESKDKEIDLVEVISPQKVNLPRKGAPGKEEVDGFVYEIYTKDFKEKLVERQMRSNPMVVFRWDVSPGEVYGRGVVLKALSDIKTLNKVQELILQNASLSVSGAYTVVDDGTVNVKNLKIRPGAVIPVSANDGSPQGRSIDALPRTGDFNVGQFILQDMQRKINEAMFTDPLGPVDLPVKTATEISIRQQELAKRIGSSFGRLQREMLSPVMERVMEILDDIGEIDLGGFKIDGEVIDIEFESPLARSEDEEELVRLMNFGRTMSEIYGPQAAAMILDARKFPQKVALMAGIDLSVLGSEESMEQFASLMERMSGGGQQGGGQPQQQTTSS